MRELTDYEKQKWGEWHRFELSEDDFLNYGDELGEAFLAALSCVGKRDYGLSDEFVAHAMVQSLDMYYDQLVFFYMDAYEEPEEYGLPSEELVASKSVELGVNDQLIDYGNTTDEARQLWDWAMEWRDEHREETYVRQRKEHLQRELARLEEGYGRNA